MWGTSTKGSIPGTDKLADHPLEINVDECSASSISHISLSRGSGIVLQDGSAYVWGGSNEYGQLGLGHNNNNDDDISTPTKIIDCELAEKGVAQLALGKQFSAAIDKEGDLYSFGFGGSAFKGMGYLGLGDYETYHSPQKVTSLVEDGCLAKQVAVGNSHMTVLTTEGETLTTGAASYGRLGNLETNVDQLYLEPVEMLAGFNVVQITGGHAFSLALTDEGIIHGWGRNDKGQLGLGGGLVVDMYSLESVPVPIEGQLENRKVKKVAAGDGHAACITEDGEAFTWGMSMYMEPQAMESLLHTKIIDVTCGENFTLFLSDEGQVYAMGKGKYGTLGQLNTKSMAQPTLVEGLLSYKVTAIEAGVHHVACLAESLE